MGDNSKIEWTDATWNPITGCDKISPGCDNCYAERVSESLMKRFGASGPYPHGFNLTFRRDMYFLPLKWKRPRHIFVNSMSDLFHKDIPDNDRLALFDVMLKAHWHTYQILTKRSSLMRDFINKHFHPAGPRGILPPHIWLGVSVEDGLRGSRIQHLQQTQCAVRFLSVEPLIGDPGMIDLRSIHWVIVGGESGPNARPMNPYWARGLRDQCIEAGVPFFFKQWGGRYPKTGGAELDGREWKMMPGDSYESA